MQLSLKQRKHRLAWGIAAIAAISSTMALIPDRYCIAILQCESITDAAHSVAFFSFTFVLAIYLRFLRMSLLNVLWASFVIAAAFGGLIEALQGLTPDRSPSWGDVNRNLLGTGIGLIAFLLLRDLMGRFRPIYAGNFQPIKR